MSNIPSFTSPVFAQDEDVCVAAGSDFSNLCPASQMMATGVDGVFAADTPWVMTSASVDFQAYGVQPNQVVRLSMPKQPFAGNGALLAIDSVAPNTLVLRRLHQDLNVGAPPGPPTGLGNVTFTITTFNPQIEEASFALKRRFAIDENWFYRSSSWIYDLRDLRMATVWTVLRDRYAQETRAKDSDFYGKLVMANKKLTEILEQISIRWGVTGNAQEPTTAFSGKITR